VKPINRRCLVALVAPALVCLTGCVLWGYYPEYRAAEWHEMQNVGAESGSGVEVEDLAVRADPLLFAMFILPFSTPGDYRLCGDLRNGGEDEIWVGNSSATVTAADGTVLAEGCFGCGGRRNLAPGEGLRVLKAVTIPASVREMRVTWEFRWGRCRDDLSQTARVVCTLAFDRDWTIILLLTV
jgi:hypothetical protein